MDKTKDSPVPRDWKGLHPVTDTRPGRERLEDALSKIKNDRLKTFVRGIIEPNAKKGP